MAHGSLIAILAAIFFGVTTPVVKRFGAGVGAFATATLLYAGAALGSGFPRLRAGEPALAGTELRRIAVVAFFGAALAPASLAWGLQHTGALGASLLLNLEAIFTVFLARVFYGEPIGRRVTFAVTLMAAGGALLGLRAGATSSSSALGLAAVVGATLAWALDNTLTRPLADFDPRAVVFGKALGGSVLSAAIALALRNVWPEPLASLALLVCGATGYGLSLRLYLRAQRVLGAARTASLFAFGPFVGAALALGLGDRENVGLVGLASALFGIAAYLHVTEIHHHHHRHEALEHDHAHRHDDGHHAHTHEGLVAGQHSHSHRHEMTEHDHAHGEDLHHRHRHK